MKMNEIVKCLYEEMDDWLNLARQVLSEPSLEEVEDRLSSFIEQEMFWHDNENMERLAYDLNEFVCWLKNYREVKKKI